MYLIAGLGNPGHEYENTRHNMGFKVVEALAFHLEIDYLKRKKKCESLIAESIYNGTKVILAEPQTFMNNSGIAISSLLKWYKIDPTHLILIYDDLDLEIGQIRIRSEGGAGGHHGVESTIQHVGRKDFIRVRVGIGRPEFGDTTSFVLGTSKPDPVVFITASEAVLEIVSGGAARAMNKFNS